MQPVRVCRWVAGAVLGFMLAGAVTVYALDLGINITRADGLTSGGIGWYNRGVPGEDQEVEPGNYTSQAWDLEGFFLKGRVLSMVGGWDFRQGYGGFRSGDLFIDVNGNAQFGPAAQGSFTGVFHHAFGYDYVAVLNFATGQYDVLDITGVATQSILYRINDGGNPWRYHRGGIPVSGYTAVPIGYQEGLTDAQVGYGLTGGLHQVVTVDLGFLPPGVGEIICHFTLECGNDNLMGQAVVPVASTVLLFGSGLVGLALWNAARGFPEKRRGE